MFEPTSGLWKELMERAEGKITQPFSGNIGLSWKEFVNADTDPDDKQSE